MKRTYPRGIAIAIVMIILSYLVPLLVGASIVPDYTAWDTGYFAEIGTRIGSWMGVWVVLGAMASQVRAAATAATTDALNHIKSYEIICIDSHIDEWGGRRANSMWCSRRRRASCGRWRAAAWLRASWA